MFIVSTAPSTLSGATIIFVAVDDEGILVASLGVRIADVQGDWHQQGVTASDGSFSCGIRSGVSRVRADVSPPAGYVLASKEWPREFDVSGGGSLRVEVRVNIQGLATLRHDVLGHRPVTETLTWQVAAGPA